MKRIWKPRRADKILENLYSDLLALQLTYSVVPVVDSSKFDGILLQTGKCFLNWKDRKVWSELSLNSNAKGLHLSLCLQMSQEPSINLKCHREARHAISLTP